MRRTEITIYYLDGTTKSICILDEPIFSMASDFLIDEDNTWWYLRNIIKLTMTRLDCVDYCSCRFANDDFKCNISPPTEENT